jgi:intracellular septation protein
MKLLFDLLPIIVFFSLYKLINIYAATAATIAVAVLQTALYWFKNRQIDYLLLITTCLIVVLGTTTLLLHNEIFIKWKPTAISWAFALGFIGSHFIGKKPLIQLTLETASLRSSNQHLILPSATWRKLNWAWGLFYLFLGAINLYVVYHYDTDTWVNFKLFGMLALNVIFILIQTFYLTKYLSGTHHEP